MTDVDRGLSGVAETLLIPLYVRALESQRPDALLEDEKAAAILATLKPDLSKLEQLRLDEGDRVAIVLRSRQFDRQARAFMARHPGAVVVHIGCGLDARFDRVDDGRVEWYDLDLPDVIALRRQLIGDEGPRHHLLSGSAFDSTWLAPLAARSRCPMLFLAEGVLMYFEEAKVRGLVVTLRERFPGAELVFDAFSPFLVMMNNWRMRRTTLGVRYHWGLRRATALESWAPGIQLLGEWFPFDEPEPRLARYRWVRYLPLLATVMGVFHYRLGEAPAEPRSG